MAGRAVDVDGVTSSRISGRAYSSNAAVTCIPSGAIQSSGTFFSRFATFWTSTASVMHW
ncbi:MAG: hypothetical protein ACLUIR_09180 [Faecalibacterium prausnitzii]